MCHNIKRYIVWLLIVHLFSNEWIISSGTEIIDEDTNIPPTMRSPIRFGKRLSSEHLLNEKKCLCYSEQNGKIGSFYFTKKLPPNFSIHKPNDNNILYYLS
jgi:hypothetical protein